MATRDMTKIEGTIACCFARRASEFESCISPEQMRAKALELLNDPSLANNATGVTEAKNRISHANRSAIYSLIGTYMSGLKV